MGEPQGLRPWDEFQAKLLTKVIAEGGPLQPGKGWTTVHLDSWEMSSQNWTSDFRTEFQTRRGYDPKPYYPTFMESVVGTLETTERFLWDMRKTSQELVLEEYAGKIKQIAHSYGMLYSNEPYDMNPAGNIDLGSLADIPMCEFWYAPNDTIYSCIEAASISHTMGQQIVRAESFTSRADEFAKHPAKMKNQTDWAFGIGINSIIFHTYQHQPLGSSAKPGMTMGKYGIQWHRNNTIWEFLNPYHEYITRCSHMLQQGEAVSDILYLTPEGAPHVFYEPDDATEGASNMPDKKGYSFDAVTPRILGMRATVDGGRIAFPDGSKYRVMVLPDSPTMTPETLAVIEQLVQDGATIIGNPPVKSPSLVNYPACDTLVSTLANTMWGATTPPGTVTPISYGNGTIYWGGGLDPASGLYPTYAQTAALLASLGLPQDFSSPSGKIRYTHRQNADCDFYFVSNRSSERVETEGLFRIYGLQPELWDPLTGETRALEEFSVAGGVTTIPLTFEPLQSYFIVFPHETSGTTPPASPVANFDTLHNFETLAGSWSVSFDPAMGAPANVVFSQLVDWTTRPERAIKYYSGTASYQKTFDLPAINPALNPKIFLDLGTVHDICRVTLNGQDLGTLWTSPWRVDITASAQPTGNVLQIEVANVWANRLIGDEQTVDSNVRTLSWPSGLLGGASYQAGRYSYATWNHFTASSALLPAGLLGPVKIVTNSVDPSPPSTSMLIPRDNVTTPIVPTKINITFNEAVKAGTGRIAIRNLDDGTDTLINADDASQVSFEGETMVVSPGDITDLNYGGTDYTTNFQTQFPSNFILSDTAGFLGSTANNADYFGRVDNFIVETTPFVVSTLDPATGSTGIAADTDLILTFNQPVTAGSGALTIHLSNGIAVQTIDVNSSAVSIDDSEVTVDLPASLAAGIGYYVLFPPGAFLDAIGSPHVGISDPSGWAFTVAANPSLLIVDDFNDTTLDTEWNLSEVLNQGPGASVTLDTASFPGGLGYTFTGASGSARQHVLLRNDVTLNQPGDFIQTSVRLVDADTNQLFFGLAIDQSSATPGNRDELVALFVDGTGAVGILDGSVPAVVAISSPGTVNDANDTFLKLTLTTSNTLQASYSIDGVNFLNFGDPVAINGVSAVGYYTGNSRSSDLGSGVADDFTVLTTVDFGQWIGSFDLLPGERGFNIDADGDHLQNGVEAWFGANPSRNDQGLTGLTVNGSVITFQHPQSTSHLIDLAGYYEWSPNLVDWYHNGSGPMGGPSVTFVTSTLGSITTVTATASAPFEQLFIRAAVCQLL